MIYCKRTHPGGPSDLRSNFFLLWDTLSNWCFRSNPGNDVSFRIMFFKTSKISTIHAGMIIPIHKLNGTFGKLLSYTNVWPDPLNLHSRVIDQINLFFSGSNPSNPLNPRKKPSSITSNPINPMRSDKIQLASHQFPWKPLWKIRCNHLPSGKLT